MNLEGMKFWGEVAMELACENISFPETNNPDHDAI
jgi:hypothetical protein